MLREKCFDLATRVGGVTFDADGLARQFGELRAGDALGYFDTELPRVQRVRVAREYERRHADRLEIAQRAHRSVVRDPLESSNGIDGPRAGELIHQRKGALRRIAKHLRVL